ncbi:MAG: aminoacyl-tRNA deacylase [Ferrovibrio sp.]|uniref:aminoacyl-tRNA deacylase n=1 Tax=Ferrovibrio sp. TaxID=1917215 RepID=UPI00391DCD39
MGLAISLQEYLDHCDVPYEVIEHQRTNTMRAAAHYAGVPEDKVAKAVLLEDEDGYMLALVPACCAVELGHLSRLLHRRIGLATENELAELFADCEIGAVPALGTPYGIEMVIDDRLDGCDDLYFEGGDHCSLVHIRGRDLQRLLPQAMHARIGSRH